MSAIAIIGMACRFPGAEDYRAFRDNLRAGRDTIPRHDRASLLEAGVDPAWLDHPAYVAAGGAMPGAEMFDAAFFDIAPAEACLMDPQHRLFLECAWAALEDGGHASAGPADIGVFAGANTSLYLLQHLLQDHTVPEGVTAQALSIACKPDFMPARTANRLNLIGPAVNVQAGCATGLVAVDMAIASLQSGACTMALAGAVSLARLQRSGYMHHPHGLESADGYCRAFDAAADGSVGTSGVAVLLLRPLESALAAGDPIHAVIIGSATGHDGSAGLGFTVPAPDGQTRCATRAWQRAGVEASSIGMVEAQGTATPLGDVVEVAALTELFRRQTTALARCALGSVKSNVGHLDACAGLAGLIKAVLAVQHAEHYPSLHFDTPNPELRLESSPFFVPVACAPWDCAGPRRAAVNAFAAGGMNAHVVLEQAPARPSLPQAGPALLVLSARTDAALAANAAALAGHLITEPHSLGDTAFTLMHGRRRFEHRRFHVCRDAADAIAWLRDPDLPRCIDGPLGEAGLLWDAGAAIDPARAASPLQGSPLQGRRIPLPTYAFDRQRHWLDTAPSPAQSPPAPSATPQAWADDVEHAVAEVWQEVIGLQQVRPHDDFMACGGDSLKLTQIAGRLQARFGVEVPLSRFFQAPRVTDVATLLREALEQNRFLALLAQVEQMSDAEIDATRESLPWTT